ncbi:hypothetical protein ACRCQ4_24790 [Pseudomonas aeruginosa]
MRFWLTRYQFLLILVLALPVCPSEDFAMPLDAPASHAAESPAQPSRAEQLGAFLRRRRESIDLAEIPEEDRNCIYLALTHERWRYCMANREEALPRMVGFFRAAMVERMGDPLWERQLQRCLEASAEFREIWRRNEVMGIENQLKRFRHARCGEFELQQTNWWSAPKNGDRLLVFVPLDDHARDCLEQL